MDKPLVSVITVVYNGAATLEDTIQSLGGQTFRNFEYIIVDGGSKDATVDIIKKAGDRVTRWISEPDKGIYDAMNKGIGMANGEWLYFLGSDDRFLDTNVLSGFFADASIADYDLAYGDVLSDSYKGRYDGEFTPEKLLSRNISHQAAFYKKTLFDRLGKYDLRFKLHADWEFNLRCFSTPGIRTKYTGVVVASFGAGGVSAGHDQAFLREKLIPAKLALLEREGVQSLRRIGLYDEWWRFLRNAGIRDANELGTGKEAPPPIRQMIRCQRIIPKPILRLGPFSKCWMLVSYCINILWL